MTREDYKQKMQELEDRTALDIIKNIDEMLDDELTDLGKVAVISEVGNLILKLEKSDDKERQKVFDYIYSKSIRYAVPSFIIDMFDDILKGVTHED